MERLYNQLLLQFLRYQSETLHNCFRHIEDVHLFLKRKKVIFDKITAVWDLEIFQFLAKITIMENLYNQLLINFL